MKTSSNGDHLAVLIDADNVSSKHIAGLLAEVANYGTASVRRIYGDWTSPQMNSWTECLLQHSLTPIQQFAYTTGKNATDGAMIIDAMDLLYTGRFSSFCLVSSDSDFTRLASRIREQGISVYGFGTRHNTHKAFVAACNEFVYLDALSVQEQGPSATPQPLTQAADKPPEAARTRPPPSVNSPAHPLNQQLARPREQQAEVSGPLGHGAPLPMRTLPTPRPLDQAARDGILSPDLNARNYGYQRFRDLVEASGIVQTKMKSMGLAPPIALVRLKD